MHKNDSISADIQFVPHAMSWRIEFSGHSGNVEYQKSDWKKSYAARYRSTIAFGKTLSEALKNLWKVCTYGQ